MSLFNDQINASIGDFMAGIGEKIYINGIAIDAIFSDEEFDDEAGRYRRTTLTIARPDAQFFRKGDTVLVRDRAFTITFIPDIHEDLIDIEIKNA